MPVLDVFALAVLLLLAASIVALLIVMGWLPGWLARGRNHPWAHAVNVAGWVSLVFLPLWPLALIWAYADFPQRRLVDTEFETLRQRLVSLEEGQLTREAGE